MKLTPKNLMKLPIGKYPISRKPYCTSPNYVQKNELHVWEDEKGERRYHIGGFGDRFTLTIEKDKETNELSFNAFVSVANELFEMRPGGSWDIKQYSIKTTLPH